MRPPAWKLVFLVEGILQPEELYTIQDLAFLPPGPRALREILSRDCEVIPIQNPKGRWVLSWKGKDLIADAERLKEQIQIKGWSASEWFKNAEKTNQKIIIERLQCYENQNY